ncbi:MAG: hypothetical protein ACI4WH_03360 [Oscillospiraceae bacterium]
MAYTNGYYMIEVNGTLTDFFALLKEYICNKTDWQLVSYGGINLSFNTNIYDIVLNITDTKITDLDSTVTSNSLLFSATRNDIVISSFNVNYFNTAKSQTDICERRILLSVHSNANIDFVCFRYYGAYSKTFEFTNTVGKVNVQSIQEDGEEQRYILADKFYDPSSDTSLTFTKPLTYPAVGGLVLNNLLLQKNNQYYEYCPTLYNCSTIGEGKYYNISGKRYFSLDPNILVEE